MKRSLLVLGAWAAAASACGGGGPSSFGDVPSELPTFVEMTSQAGFTTAQGPRRVDPDCLFDPAAIAASFPAVSPPDVSSEIMRQCDPERSSSGAAAVDVNGDGLEDVVYTRIYGHPLLYLNESTPGQPRFRDATTGSGLDRLTASTNGVGAADIDNDGDQDVMITTLAGKQAYLLVNDGTGVFTEEAESRGVAMIDGRPHSGMGVSFGDYDLDGWVDLHTNEWQSADVAVYGEPSHSRLFRNLGADGTPGRFRDVTEESGTKLESKIDYVYSFSSSFTDFDGDGYPDLKVASDFDTSKFFWNNGDGTFTNQTYESGLGGEENGMGLAVGFYGVGQDPVMFLTSIRARPDCDDGARLLRTGNRLYRYAGNRQFEDITDLAGVRNSYWGWGTTFVDATNSGSQDIVSAAGMAITWEADAECYAKDPLRYWRNDGTGVFEERSTETGLVNDEPSKGVLFFDADRDGKVDLFVTRDAATPLFFHNRTQNVGAWLGIDVVGSETNRDGIGAVVTVRATADGAMQKGIVGTVGSFLTQDSRTMRFGFGRLDGPVAEVVVSFPASGREVRLTDVEPNRVVTVEEPTS